MFIVESSLAKPDSKPNQLIGALIEAKNRGVDVEVVLDQNVDFVKTRGQFPFGDGPLFHALLRWPERAENILLDKLEEYFRRVEGLEQ